MPTLKVSKKAVRESFQHHPATSGTKSSVLSFDGYLSGTSGRHPLPLETLRICLFMLTTLFPIQVVSDSGHRYCAILHELRHIRRSCLLAHPFRLLPHLIRDDNETANSVRTVFHYRSNAS